MNDSDAKKLYDEYMKSWYSAENIAKAGGVENHAKIIRDFKKKERRLKITNKIKFFLEEDLSFILVFAVIAIFAKYMFLPEISSLKITLLIVAVGIARVFPGTLLIVILAIIGIFVIF